MDGPQYPSNGIIGSSAPQTYPSPTTLSPHQLQTGSPLPQTLPPLQPSVSAMQQPLYGSHPHTPRTPGTPNTPNSNTNGNGPSNGSGHPQQQQQQQQQPYQPQTSQPQGRPGPYAMAQNPYAPHQGYATSGPMMPQTTTAASHPQPIAPAPAGGRGPPVLRPMPPAGMPGSMGPLPHAPGGHMLPAAEWKNSGWMPQPEQPGEAPTHVVGSQGRRGILPSAPGRPAAPAAGTGAGKQTVIPVKDADGKFPCPHCTKTYLHAKHLKRHLLRHTGDRPYMCVLCRDTFSRSDILKRHFQKCSIRRGNPTGATHLSHPLAHARRNQNNNVAAQQKPAGAEGDMGHVNGMNNMPPSDGMVHPFGMVPVSDNMNNMNNDQNQLSRSSSMGNGTTPDRRSMPGPGMGSSQPYPSDVSNSMTSQQMPYSMPPGQNGMPMYGGSNPNQQSSLDWSQMFQAGAHQTYVNNSPFPPNLGQTQIATKTEPKTESDRTTDESNGEPLVFNEWGIPSTLPNAFNTLSNQILNFLYPPDEAVDPHLSGMNLHFSPDNIHDFLDQYHHFHVHTPLLHVPTFRIMEVGTGLWAAMCCIGACYSSLVSSSVVRDMMDVTWSALERDNKLMTDPNLPGPVSHAANPGIEDMQSFLLMIIVHLWNGTPVQRERARRSYPNLVAQARRLNLMQVLSDAGRQSPLHLADFDASHLNAQHFDWRLWVDQERRIRLMLGIYLCDTAMGLYFNIAARIDPSELHLPLPCDDAAWDATSPELCAAALGLYGNESAQKHNPYGTQRAKQPQVDWALQALLHNSYEVQPGSTNLYGKFVLIHALIALVRRAQVDGQVIQLPTPPRSDCIKSGNLRGERSAQGSGDVDPRGLDALTIALDKFKEMWDVDIRDQFPPQASGANNPRRHGFSRDAIHFYWTARYLIKFTTPEDLDMAPDQRLVLVFEILKGVRSWVTSDAFSRGEELGSIGEIDDQFAITDLDLTKLFKPIPTRVGEDTGTPSVNTV